MVLHTAKNKQTHFPNWNLWNNFKRTHFILFDDHISYFNFQGDKDEKEKEEKKEEEKK